MNMSHIDEEGKGKMVDVSEKPVTARRARAKGAVYVREATLDAITENRVAKGDVLSTARIAGIMAAKQCGELIPLCHNLPLDSVEIELRMCPTDPPRVEIESSVSCHGRTGVEMEALVAVMVAALTVYDMIKSMDREAVIGDVCVTEKAGGKSGHFVREESPCKAE